MARATAASSASHTLPTGTERSAGEVMVRIGVLFSAMPSTSAAASTGARKAAVMPETSPSLVASSHSAIPREFARP